MADALGEVRLKMRRPGTGTAHCSSHRKPLRLLDPPK